LLLADWFSHPRPSKPLISLRDAGSGWKIGGGRCPLTPGQLDRRGRFQAGRWEAAHGPFIVASSTRISFLSMPFAPAGSGRLCVFEAREAGQVLTGTQDNEQIIERVAALDIGKAGLVCCVRVPGEDRPGRRLQEVESYSTMTRPLLGMAGRLACLGGDPGGDGGHQRLLEAGVLPAGGGRVRGSGWPAPRTSSTCRGGRRPAGWMRSGCARPRSGR
jgi:hypothetical protein